jgi:hypothetical protein
MIEEDTVFILGAGASCPYGFPDGKELRKEICENSESDIHNYLSAVDNFRSTKAKYLYLTKDFLVKFFNSSIKSIDKFLVLNNKFMEIGKWAIILRILHSEDNSVFREKMIKKEQDWYTFIFNNLINDITSASDYSLFGDNSISIITFNYDRSFENFLFDSLINSFYGIKPKQINTEIKRIPIIHIFGSLGSLEWENNVDNVPYRTSSMSLNLDKIKNNINIIYEQEESSLLKSAIDIISQAKRIFFLGFGFLEENLKLLKIPEILNQNQKIYGTAFKALPEEISKIEESIKPKIEMKGIVDYRNLKIEDCDCLRLLRKYL